MHLYFLQFCIENKLQMTNSAEAATCGHVSPCPVFIVMSTVRLHSGTGVSCSQHANGDSRKVGRRGTFQPRRNMEPAKWTINLPCVTPLVALSPAVLTPPPGSGVWSLKSAHLRSPQLVDTSHKSPERLRNDSLESPATATRPPTTR